jgi:hypothetical protein
VDQFLDLDLGAFRQAVAVDQKAEHGRRHAHLFHLCVRGQPGLQADQTRAARQLATQDLVLIA